MNTIFLSIVIVISFASTKSGAAYDEVRSRRAHLVADLGVRDFGSVRGRESLRKFALKWIVQSEPETLMKARTEWSDYGGQREVSHEYFPFPKSTEEIDAFVSKVVNYGSANWTVIIKGNFVSLTQANVDLGKEFVFEETQSQIESRYPHYTEMLKSLGVDSFYLPVVACEATIVERKNFGNAHLLKINN